MKTKNKKEKYISYNTMVSEMEKKGEYNLGLKKDMKIGDYFIKTGYPELSELLKD